MAKHNVIGEKGEEAAREYLRRKGYKLVEANYRTRRAEIDIVARDGDELVFVEVRTKKNDHFGTPEETINREKLYRLENNALGYVHRMKYTGAYRVDALCIVLEPSDGSGVHMAHYRNITGF